MVMKLYVRNIDRSFIQVCLFFNATHSFEFLSARRKGGWKLKVIFVKLNNDHLLHVTKEIYLLFSFNTEQTTLVRHTIGL
jgi:hypothetical protein